jgi:hypothetical protein
MHQVIHVLISADSADCPVEVYCCVQTQVKGLLSVGCQLMQMQHLAGVFGDRLC